ncbi:MAG: hypothetical protein QM392_04665 [Bacillota bacterium]|jgi:dolichol kinase|nr:hypothetical protein [Bacillota bacterium]NLL88474.1 hypothetical protein [Bacillota bacterium]
MSRLDWIGVGMFFIYFITGAGSIALISWLVKIPREIMRKAYHLMACGSVFVLLAYFEHWHGALAAIGLFSLVVLAVVPLGMVLPVRRISIQRGGTVGEILYQAGLFALGLAVLISLIWGLVGEEYKIHIAVGITALGLGDASAALIGKYFGKTKLRLKLFDRRKTIEGSLAMTGFAFIGIFVLLLLFTDIHIGLTLATALVLACLSAFLEAVAVHGLDTILIPLIIAFSSLGLFLLNLHVVQLWL